MSDESFIPRRSSSREKSFTAYRCVPGLHETTLSWQPSGARVLHDPQQILVFSTLQ